MVYEYKGFNFPVSAQVVGEDLEKLQAEKNEFTTQDIVDRATPKESPLHPIFEWNDKVAANNNRKDTANRLLHCLIVVPENEDEPETNAFLNVVIKAPAREGKYLDVRNAMSDADYRKIILQNALNELKSFQKKYQQLSEFALIFDAIDETQSRMNG